VFTLLRLLPLRRVLSEQAPTLAVSWLIAEWFYKFGSFTLELSAFLATWFALDALQFQVRKTIETAD
jgi:hypothetical protein